MTQAQKWAYEAMHLKNENVDLEILNEKLLETNEELLSALKLIATHIPGTEGHPSVKDCHAQMHADAIIAIKAAKDA